MLLVLKFLGWLEYVYTWGVQTDGKKVEVRRRLEVRTFETGRWLHALCTFVGRCQS